MTPAQRIEFLIMAVAGGNANTFAEKTGIFPSKITYLRTGTGNIKYTTYYPRILAAYPEINERWLIADEGRPLARYTMADYAEENKMLWGLVRQMQKNLAQYAKIIDRLTASAEGSAERH